MIDRLKHNNGEIEPFISRNLTLQSDDDDDAKVVLTNNKTTTEQQSLTSEKLIDFANNGSGSNGHNYKSSNEKVWI